MVPYARWTQIERADPGMLKANMHANVLARPRHGRLDGILLLLTSLEVRAYPAPPAEALARAQLLLDFPPTPDKIDDWRATIQSLIGFANGDTPRPATTSHPRQASQVQANGD